MFDTLLKKLRRKRNLTPEDLAAREQAKQMRHEMETLRTGSIGGAENFTYGGRESRGG